MQKNDNRQAAARAVLLTGLAMLAFAGNSILCRLALKLSAIDPASFTGLRLAAGAFALVAVVAFPAQSGTVRPRGATWLSGIALFLYAVFFSFAYVALDVATGALILFGCVQATMIGAGLARGDRPGPLEWAGWLLAAAGLALLLLPGARAPSLAGAVLMAAAGIAWGVYSLRGRRAGRPLEATAGNFLRALAFAAPLVVLAAGELRVSPAGALLAVVSGAITSGAGYVLWYAALAHLTSMQAALVQLSVPAIAAAGGVLLLAEPLSPRLTLSGAMILGGICLALVRRTRRLPA
ncbi:MAG TPA: DMT family transporter [Woeseiaceae bacterium]|nr:DMT family transporter [Woeseiaceae bacterium]